MKLAPLFTAGVSQHSGQKSNDLGFSIQLPASRLSFPINADLAPVEDVELADPQLDKLAPRGFVEAVQAKLKKHIGDKGFNVDKAVELCGFSKSALKRRLTRLVVMGQIKELAARIRPAVRQLNAALKESI